MLVLSCFNALWNLIHNVLDRQTWHVCHKHTSHWCNQQLVFFCTLIIVRYNLRQHKLKLNKPFNILVSLDTQCISFTACWFPASSSTSLLISLMLPSPAETTPKFNWWSSSTAGESKRWADPGLYGLLPWWRIWLKGGRGDEDCACWDFLSDVSCVLTFEARPPLAPRKVPGPSKFVLKPDCPQPWFCVTKFSFLWKLNCSVFIFFLCPSAGIVGCSFESESLPCKSGCGSCELSVMDWSGEQYSPPTVPFLSWFMPLCTLPRLCDDWHFSLPAGTVVLQNI